MAALLAIPTAAFAYAPTGDDFITCVAGGDLNVECVAGDFEEGCVIDILVTAGAEGETAPPGPERDTDTVKGTVIGESTATADADGHIEFDFDVPEDQADGEIRVTLHCPDDDKVLSAVIASVTDGEVIANAGFDTITVVGIAALALAAGGGILAVSRRRSSSSEA